jgi:hypothetical protein
MSVLKLRRDMVVVEDEPAADAVAEIEKPFPLRKIERETSDVIEGEVTELSAELSEEAGLEDHHGKTFFQHVRFWFNATIILAAVSAYPAMVVAASDVGDGAIDSTSNRAEWTAPWIGGTVSLLEKHFDALGWANDAPGWSPMARLTAKPAYQAAMAGSLGDFIKLMDAQAIAANRVDPDLQAASRLVSAASTGIQLRAARDALTNYDRRLRRRDLARMSSGQQVVAQLGLLASWSALSQDEIAASARSVGGSPIDEEATRAVYAAKGRAVVAFTLLDALQWPENPSAAKARAAALAAWKNAAQFHPLVVLNGDPDGSVFGNHPISMGYLVEQAQKATAAFLAELAAAPVQPATIQPSGVLAPAGQAPAATAAGSAP